MNERTKAILDYLKSLSGTGVISGQFGSYGDGESPRLANDKLEEIYALSGKYPALTGMDYHRADRTMDDSIAEANAFLIEKAKAGYLTTISWHTRNPFTGGKPTDRTGYNRLGELIDPRTAVYQQYINALSHASDGLYALKQAGVTVLWRPFHELNGAWFWWGGAADAQPMIALWRHMHDFFKSQGLDNLLWVYAPNAGKRVVDFYPGDDFVDIVGIDKYLKIGAALELNKDREYDLLTATGKPFMLTEFGARPASGEGWNTFVYDWRKFIDELLTVYPRCVGFLAWEHVWRVGYVNEGKTVDIGQAAMMNHPAVVTLDKLPDFAAPPDPIPDPSPVLTELTVRRIALEEVTAAEGRITAALLAKLQTALNNLDL